MNMGVVWNAREIGACACIVTRLPLEGAEAATPVTASVDREIEEKAQVGDVTDAGTDEDEALI